ncbi:MAG: hypothetical protein M0R80_02950 [Proteobacteria bacterium]|jgi:hypothetical protein|nr:hypothetical protein [Pseudomonadota bacterium]
MVKELFLQTNIYPFLGHRAQGFYKIVEHLENNPHGYIIETGTTRGVGGWYSEGQSTLIWDWVKTLLPDIKIISIDKDQSCINIAKSQTKHVEYVCDDSVNALNTMSGSITKDTILLYLDSMDWSEKAALESSLHHLCELACVWTSLPKGCLIVVDDRHSETMGKHIMVEQFMNKLGIIPFFKEYQIAWIK